MLYKHAFIRSFTATYRTWLPIVSKILSFDVIMKGNVRNFNDNAATADTKKRATGSNRDVLQASAVNRNWNAGDTEDTNAAEPAAVPDDEGAVGEDNRKISNAGRQVLIAVPAGADDTTDASETVNDIQRKSLAGDDETIAKLRRLSSIGGDNVGERELSRLRKQKRRPSKQRVCVRRCIAEDETWDIKTVPDLDMLVVKYLADNFSGTFNAFEASGLYTCTNLPH